MQIFLFVALLIAALAAVFALQNSTPVQVSFLTWEFDSSLAIVLLTALAGGALMSFFVSMPGNLRARWLIRQQRKKMTEMEAGLAETQARLEETGARLSEATAKLDDANARAEMLEARLPALPESVDLPSPDDPSAAELPAPNDAALKEPPAKPKVYSIFSRQDEEQ